MIRNTLARTSRRSTIASAALAAGLSAVVTVALVTPGSAGAKITRAPAVPAPPTVPTRADQIQNIGQVTSAIKAYYKDTLSGRTNPDGTPEHVPATDGNYAKEVAAIIKRADGYLSRQGDLGSRKKAIVLDVDDTSLNTYNYEIASNFTYNPTANAAFVNAEAFPAVYGMPALAQAAQSEGYTVFYLTGRPESQRTATEGNLTNAGFPVTDSQVYLKDLTKPIYSSCYNPPTSTCTTIQYKSLTRKYIQSQGYYIAGNFGDQYSDLSGGYARKTFKLPNPMYYLP